MYSTMYKHYNMVLRLGEIKQKKIKKNSTGTCTFAKPHCQCNLFVLLKSLRVKSKFDIMD